MSTTGGWHLSTMRDWGCQSDAYTVQHRQDNQTGIRCLGATHHRVYHATPSTQARAPAVAALQGGTSCPTSHTAVRRAPVARPRDGSRAHTTSRKNVSSNPASSRGLGRGGGGCTSRDLWNNQACVENVTSTRTNMVNMVNTNQQCSSQWQRDLAVCVCAAAHKLAYRRREGAEERVRSAAGR